MLKCHNKEYCFNNRIVRGGACLSMALLGVLVFLAFMLSSPRVLADDDTVIDTVTIRVPASCTLAGVGTESHNASINNGTYNSNVGTTTLKALCNDNNGFAIYAAGYTGNEVGGTNSNKLVSANNLGNISTGTGTTGDSQWAMKLTTNSNDTYPITIESDTNGSFSNFHVVPNEFVKVASRNSGTDMGSSAVGSVLTTTYQVYISASHPAGSYSGKVIYALVHPATHSAPVICNPDATTISEVKCMQDFGNLDSANRAAILASMTAGQQYTMQDKRDGKTYTIAKLADGNVWMTQNLDLDLVAGVTYTNEDTDIGYNTTTGEYETAAWSPMRSTYATSNSQTTAWCQGGLYKNYYCNYNYTPESYDPGDLYWNSTLSDYSDWDTYYDTCDFTTSTPSCSGTNPIGTYTSSTGTAELHLGNYYNWTAAMAMNDSSSHTTQNELIEQSICPAGWTLPRTGGGEDTFYALWNEYGMSYISSIDANSNESYDNGETALWTQPLYFSASGYFGGMLDAVGGGGFFWSPVVGDVDDAGYANFSVNGYANPSDVGRRSNGNSIRCVARPVSSSIALTQ